MMKVTGFIRGQYFGVYGLLLLLVSCTPYHGTPEQKSCLKNCASALNRCHQKCEDNCTHCVHKSNIKAIDNFEHYKKEKFVEGGIIARNLQSYRDPLQCLKTTCNCSADYRVCAQSCMGEIHKRLQVQPQCC